MCNKGLAFSPELPVSILRKTGLPFPALIGAALRKFGKEAGKPGFGWSVDLDAFLTPHLCACPFPRHTGLSKAPGHLARGRLCLPGSRRPADQVGVGGQSFAFLWALRRGIIQGPDCSRYSDAALFIPHCSAIEHHSHETGNGSGGQGSPAGITS